MKLAGINGVPAEDTRAYGQARAVWGLLGHSQKESLDKRFHRVGQKRTVLEVCNSRSRICWHRLAFYISNCSVFLSRVSKTGVLCVTVFQYSLRNFSATTLRYKWQLILAMTFILREFHLKSIINANIVYIPVEATFSTSMVCANHCGQYFNWYIAVFIVCWLWSQLSSCHCMGTFTCRTFT